MNRIRTDISQDAYYAHTFSDVPYLSQSIAKIIMTQSPFHAWLAHPKFGNVQRETNRPMWKGSLIHALLLDNPIAGKFEVIKADSYRTKQAQTDRDNALLNGKTPILEAEFERIYLLAEWLKEKYGELFEGYQSETVVTWTEKTELGDVECKGMLDLANFTTAKIRDIKLSDADPESISKSIYNLGYDIQHAAYTSAMRKIVPEMAGRESFQYVFIEELPDNPHRPAIVTITEFGGEYREMGERRWNEACKVWKQCTTTNHWPDYMGGATLSAYPPAFAIQREL